ncbi:MAG: EAL domain-containing protein, partial [Rhodocyclaceae bacterium]|nr:EAL domain-containing protein [Rhodocyclaceae bacterium]
IFEGSLEIAKQLRMEVVAEGVEDEKDWEFLASANCGLAQGYFISRPVPPAELAAWQEQWKQRLPLR